ncbi:MAG: SDR family oxidoreductase [Lentisphaerae bacterium]|nr:MAG: SDR family oxidoreductase [Lentisphaerota bacterium]
MNAPHEKTWALVTGASRGIGQAIVQKLLDHGWNVIACSRKMDESHNPKQTSSSSQLLTFRCNIADPIQVETMFRKIDELAIPLQVLVNNAGIGIFAPFEELTLDDWDRVMNVNARGCFHCSREAFLRMKKHGHGGHIINIASVVALKGYTNQAIYTASKHAMLGLARVIAKEGQPYNIRCSTICPGGVATDMVRAARPDLDERELIAPEDIAETVLFLLSQPNRVATDLIQLRRGNSLPDF